MPSDNKSGQCASNKCAPKQPPALKPILPKTGYIPGHKPPITILPKTDYIQGHKPPITILPKTGYIPRPDQPRMVHLDDVISGGSIMLQRGRLLPFGKGKV